MFIKMILDAIPRSIRAGVALVVTFIFLGVGLQALTQLITPGEHSAMLAIRCIVGLVVGSAAGIVFYYFQAKDGNPQVGTGLDTIHAYHKDRQEEERLRSTPITPAYPSEGPEQHDPPKNN